MRAINRRWALGLAAMFGILLSGCEELPRGATDRNDLSKMATAEVTVINKAGQRHTFNVWLARTPAEQTRGLMNVTEDELPHDKGMLFIFPYDQVLGFWMRNTIIPLDIAYIRSDGTIVRGLTMQALDETSRSSIEPARFALELRSGELAARGIAAGDHVEIPASVLNQGP